MLPHNTPIEVRTGGFGYPVGWERAHIRNRKTDARHWGSLDDMPGWHRVTFADGGIMCINEEGFRVVEPLRTNMPFAVYRCDKLGRGKTPKNEVMLSGHLTPMEAMDEAERLTRGDPRHSYVVGSA